MGSYVRQPRYKSKVRLFKGTYTKINGVNKQNYTETETTFKCAKKSYGGTEVTKNGVLVIEDTFIIECAYREDLTSKDAIQFLNEDGLYEIINRPELIGDEKMTMVFKVRKLSGGI